MSKLTLEEAIEILTNPSADDGLSLEEVHEAFRMGAEALHYKHDNRWRKLEEEKPPPGEEWYLVWYPVCQVQCLVWYGYFNDPLITHWKPIDNPEGGE